jgi:hypothetical protein
MTSSKIDDALRTMTLGTHAILVYDTQDNKREVLLKHLELGMNRTGLVYGYAEEGPDKIRREMRRFGMDANQLEEADLLTIKSSKEIYMPDGKVDADGIIKGFSDLARSYSKRGLEGIRASAEMSPFFNHGLIKDLEKYEHALHRRFSFPARGVCAYSLVELNNSGHLGTLMPMLRAHDLVMLTGPNGTAILHPDSVTEGDVETVMQVPIAR